MQELQIFNNPDFGEIRTLAIDDEPWFVGKDVATILGYAKPLNALATHVDEDDSLKQGLTDNLGRLQQTIFINESGLYSLILSSKLESAKRFKRWVTSEVLPAIRKTGKYEAKKQTKSKSKPLSSVNHAAEIMGRAYDSAGIDPCYKGIGLNRFVPRRGLSASYSAENKSRKVDFKSELQKINNSKGGINRVDTKIKTVYE